MVENRRKHLNNNEKMQLNKKKANVKSFKDFKILN